MRCKAENLHSDLHPPIHAGGQHRTRSGSGKRRPGPGTCRRPEAGHRGDTSRIGRAESRDRLKCCDDRRGRDHSPVSAAQGRFRRANDRSGCLHRRPPGAGDGSRSYQGPQGRVDYRGQEHAHQGAPPACMTCRASWPAAMTPPRSPGRAVGGLPGNRDGLGDRIIAILLELLQGGSRLFPLPAEPDCGAVPDQPAS